MKSLPKSVMRPLRPLVWPALIVSLGVLGDGFSIALIDAVPHTGLRLLALVALGLGFRYAFTPTAVVVMGAGFLGGWLGRGHPWWAVAPALVPAAWFVYILAEFFRGVAGAADEDVDPEDGAEEA